jgi:hypothetical protein
MRYMAAYIQRRNKGPAVLPERWRRQYNVWFEVGFGFSVSLSGLDKLLDGGRNPRDFWACVHAADRAFKLGDHEAVFEWPSGRRRRCPSARRGNCIAPQQRIDLSAGGRIGHGSMVRLACQTCLPLAVQSTAPCH